MFPLHDRTRRKVCVAGFLLLCVAPTLAVLGWAAAWASPWHVRAEAGRIARQLGMDIQLGRVEHLRPGAARLRNVVLRDCEEPEVVLRCEQVDVVRKAVRDSRGVRRRVLNLLTPGVEVDAERLGALDKLARRLLELRAGNAEVEIRCRVGTIDLRSAGPVARFADGRGGVQTVASGTEAWLEVRVPGHAAARPLLVRLGRNRQLRPMANYFVLDTGGAELPCELLGRSLPAMGSLGPAARFRGCLSARSTPAGWDGETAPAQKGELACELLDVDLDRLVTDRFGQTLSGKARVAVTWASWRAGRLEKAVGGVTAGPGTVSPSLVRAAAEHLGLEQPPGPSPQAGPLPYDAMAFGFQFDDRGLVLGPGWPDGGRVMVAGPATLLAATGRVCPAVALLHALAPAGSQQIPATRQTEWLWRHVALPEGAPPSPARPPWRLATEDESNGGTR